MARRVKTHRAIFLLGQIGRKKFTLNHGGH